MKSDVYRDIKNWKKPIHASKTSLAKAYLKLLQNTEIIAIAGSVGKTLTQNAVHSVISQKYKNVTGDENLDPTFRIPQTILKAKPWHKYLILEYGVEHKGDMDHYLKIALPKYAVMTLISAEHTKYLDNLEGVFFEESKIIESLPRTSYAILNSDDPLSHRLAGLTSATIVWYGSKAKKGVKISHYAQNLHGSRFRIHYQGQMASVHWKVIGKHQLTSAYIAATLGILCGLTLKQIAKGLSLLKSPNHRLNIKLTDHLAIIDDTYNSSPAAAIESINTLLELGKGRKKIAVLGEMKDLGKLSTESHIALGQKIAKTNINYLFTVGKTAEAISQSAEGASFKGKIINATSTKEISVQIKKLNFKKPLILVKGSRHAHLERVVFGLMHKSTNISCYHCGKIN
jgi:UDP-N-acetylmuramoyl-tripeptide--D-alanyl-D-alanine ligase